MDPAAPSAGEESVNAVTDPATIEITKAVLFSVTLAALPVSLGHRSEAMNLRTTALLVLASVSLAGCDEGTGRNDDFRDGTDCLKTGTGTTTKIVVKGMDPDWVMNLDTAAKFAPEQGDETVMAIARSIPDLERTCKKVCDGDGLGWTGETCVAGGDYKTGEFRQYETEDGEGRWSLELDASEVAPGCACD